MIFTCTLNPSLDYYMESPQEIVPGGQNRSTMEYYEAGGKGINVSIVLNNLEVPTKACGFLGGFTKDFYITLLEKYSFIQPTFTYIHGHTRVNVKYLDGSSVTEINAAGPFITLDDMEHLMAKTYRLDEGDHFVLAGFCPEHLHDSVMAMLERLMGDKVRVCLNTDTRIMHESLRFHPFLVKTRIAFLNEASGRSLAGEDLYQVLKAIVEHGAQNVLCTTDDGSQAYFACGKGVYHGHIIQHGKAVSMVGTGDALVAGFIMNTIGSTDAVEAFRFGCCCSEATAYSKGFGTRERIMEFYDSLTVEKVMD